MISNYAPSQKQTKLIVFVFCLTFLTFCHVISIAQNNQAVFNKFVIKKDKSSVVWTANTLKGTVNGSIEMESGFIMLRNGVPVAGEVVVNMFNIGISSIPPGVVNFQILNLMKAPNFLDVQSFPTAKIEFINIKLINFNEYEVNGFFTVKGFRAPVKFTTIIDLHDDIIESKAKTIRISRDTYQIGTKGDFEFAENKGSIDESIDKFFQIDVSIIAEKETPTE